MITETDMERLANAYELVRQVYEYNYGSSSMKKITDRLLTILNKLNEIENIILSEEE